MIHPARKHKIVDRAAAKLEPRKQADSGICRDLELDGFTCLPLNDCNTLPDVRTADQVADLKFIQIATSQLAVDRQIGQRPIANTLLAIIQEADCPDLLLIDQSLGIDLRSKVPRHTVLSSSVEL